ncbi:hypothetical protein NF556_19420 [Ornithinimicrobium faecis]|uniref:Uncharacterized protein n=1 Tax=Ornithinimicrobium faecis TaxID=2934158 RepID=A0ABY4YT22_9MICO|nr:hypothetical protein [Ornithinimicrobium sp. HY1793]USQ79729.1 hypothetical protein NF556_19420 [Ornithinimicrobium sp. HY1793]
MTEGSSRIPSPSGRSTIGIGYEQIARSIALDALDLGRAPSAGWVAARVAEHGLPWGEFNEDAWHQRIWWLASHMKPGRAPSDDEVVAVRVHHSFGTSSRRLHPLQRWKDILEGTDAVAG